MAQQTISTGTSANDGTGDTLRSAGTKINQNFTELYGRQQRITETVSTGSLADDAAGDIEFDSCGRTFILQEVKPDRAAWIRIYTDVGSRTALDSNGAIFDYTTLGDSAVRIAPGTIGWVDSDETTVPVKIVNKSGGTSAVALRIKALKLEA